jgi:choice-of-anchor B domain-containing protein
MRSPIFLLALSAFCAITAQAQISNNITLLGQFHDPSLPSAGSTRYNEVWGWTDCELNEYAILGSASRVHFFDLQNPASPQQVASFPGGSTTVWRDMKTFRDRAYSVCDNCSEGLMIFDLSDLPNSVTKTKQTTQFFSRAHNIFIDEAAGRLYAAGTNSNSGGAIILDLNADPDNPTLIGNPVLPGGYFHDIFVRNNIGYCSHGSDGLWVYDFSNPQSPVLLGTLTDYPQSGYNHSSWLSGNSQYAVMADETHNKGLKMLDVSDLSDISVTDVFRSALLAPADTASIVHNPFIRDNYIFVSYYHDGVQVFDMSNPNNVQQVAWYDTYPSNTNYNGFQGCWGVYPFLPSGTILASDMTHGLFVLSLDNITLTPIPQPTYPNDWITMNGNNPICEGQSVTLNVDPTASEVDWFLNGAPIQAQGSSIQVGEDGWYKATVYRQHCAVETDSLELDVIPLPSPVISAQGNPVICEGGSVFLSADPSATSVHWYRNGILLQVGGPLIQVQQAGTYSAVVFNQFCQVQSNAISIQVVPLPDPTITMTGNPLICEGESVTLNADPTATSVEWYLNGELLPLSGTEVEVQDPGVYSATVYNQTCPVETNSIGLNVIPLPDPEINLSGDPELCEGESLVLTVDPQITDLTWFQDGEMLSWEQPQIEVQEAGTYYAILFNQFCQIQTETVEVQVTPYPGAEIALSGDPSFCEGESVLLSADPSASAIDWYRNGQLLASGVYQIEAQQAGVYNAILSNQSCTTPSDTVEIEVIPYPGEAISLSGDPVICEGESVLLGADPGASFIEWYRDGLPMGTEGPLLEVQQEGMYFALLSNQFCTIQSDQVIIQVIPSPSPELALSGDPALCEGESVVLIADTAATFAEWYLDGVLLPETGPQLEASEAGTYSAILSNQNCTTQSETVAIEVIPFPNPEIALSGGPAICEGESVVLSADTAVTFVEWYLDGAPLPWEEPQIEVEQAGAYYAVLHNQSCSIQTDSIEIQVIPLPDPKVTIVQGSTTICEGLGATLSVNATAVEWYRNGELLGETGTELFVQEAGAYSAVLYNQDCPVLSDTVQIEVLTLPEPQIALSGDPIFCEGESVTLSADANATEVEWYFNGQLLAENGLQIEVEEEGWYTATLYNQFCSIESDTVAIQVIPAPGTQIALSGDPVLCEGQSIVLSADTAATSIEWYFNGALLPGQEAQLEVQEAGAYYAVLSNSSCTVETGPVEVQVLPFPDNAIALLGDPAICEGESALLSVDTTATFVEWYLDGELLEAGGSELEVQAAGAYYAILSNQNCAVQTDAVTIELIPAPAPEIALSGEPLLCEGESVLLSVDTAAMSIEWYLDGELLPQTGAQLEVQEAGAYFAVLSNEICTTQSDTVGIAIQEAPEPSLIYESALACQGESILLSANPGLDSWQWYLDGVPVETATGPEWEAGESGFYSYTGVLGPCEVSSDEISIAIVAPVVPAISFVNDTLFATPASTYQWYLNGEVLEGATGSFFVPEFTGTYTVGTTDANGCEAVSESIEVELISSVSAPLPQGWNIYPNPASDWLMVETPGVNEGLFALYDLMGRAVVNGRLEGEQTEIGVSRLASGVYFLEVWAGGYRERVKVVFSR